MIGQICCYAAASNVNIMNIVVPPPSRSLLHVNASHIPSPAPGSPAVSAPRLVAVLLRPLIWTHEFYFPPLAPFVQNAVMICNQPLKIVFRRSFITQMITRGISGYTICSFVKIYDPSHAACGCLHQFLWSWFDVCKMSKMWKLEDFWKMEISGESSQQIILRGQL